MSTPAGMDRDRLAAFADGELSPEEAAAVVMHLADHPEDQAYVDDLMAANATLARAFGSPMSQTVPPAILAVIEGRQAPADGPSPVIRLMPRSARLAALAGAALALAASVGLVAVLWSPARDAAVALGPVDARDALHGPLQDLPSGRSVALTPSRDLTVLATLPVASGHCREVEILDRGAARIDIVLACNRGGGWVVEAALSEPLVDGAAGEGYVPASGAAVEVMGALLDRLGAGMVLDPVAEAAAIAGRWRQ